MRTCAVASFTLLAACASSGSGPSSAVPGETVRIVGGSGVVTQMSMVAAIAPTDAIIPSSRDRVSQMLPAVRKFLAIPVTRMDASRHILGNESLNVRQRLGDPPLTRFFDGGRAQGGPNAETYESHLSILTETPDAAPGSTLLSTTIQATARPVNFAAVPLRCSSKGTLEAMIVDQIIDLLQG